MAQIIGNCPCCNTQVNMRVENGVVVMYDMQYGAAVESRHTCTY